MNGYMTSQIQQITEGTQMTALGRVVGATLGDATGSVLLVVIPSDRLEQVKAVPVGIPVPSDARCVAVLAGKYGSLCVWAWA